MSMIVTHKAAILSRSSCHHEFLLRYKKRTKVVYGFVEGADDPCFYRGFIEALLPDDWDVELWPAGSKEHVLLIQQRIDWRRFPKRRVCFFVDRDLGQFLGEKGERKFNVYETDGYSIENSVVQKNTLRRVLTEVCGITAASHTELDKIVALFDREFDRFLSRLLPIMAAIIVWRRAEERPLLANVQMQRLFAVDKGRLVLVLGGGGASEADVLEYVRQRCKVGTRKVVGIRSAKAELRRGGRYRKVARGKYALWFFVEFCRSVHRDATTLFSACSRQPKVKVALTHSNCMMLVGPRARIPLSLKHFVEKTYCEYVATHK